jgi:hypothetical protein
LVTKPQVLVPVGGGVRSGCGWSIGCRRTADRCLSVTAAIGQKPHRIDLGICGW